MCLFLSPSLSLSLKDWLIPVYGVVAIVLILVLAIGVASVLLLVACVQGDRGKALGSRLLMFGMDVWNYIYIYIYIYNSFFKSCPRLS